MKLYLVTITLLLLSINPIVAETDWGKLGHRVTGQIAQQHLSENTKNAIIQLLDGQSLAVVSTFGDEIKSDPKYRKYNPYHYVNFPFGSKYETTPKSKNGDLIQAIETCIMVLKDENSSKVEKAFNLKMLVHFIADLHMPLHVGIADDKGGNDFQVRWFNSGTNLHTVWDTKMLESYGMSYTEIAENAQKISKSEIENIQNGTVMDWMYDSRKRCENIYENTTVGEKLGYDYMYKYVDVARSQLQKGGLRLAELLNDIFG